MPSAKLWCNDLCRSVFIKPSHSPHWEILQAIGAADELSSRADLTFPRPWVGPLGSAQRAVALQPRSPKTWMSPCPPLQPISFRPRDRYSFNDNVAVPLAGAFTQMCTLSTQLRRNDQMEDGLALNMNAMMLEQPQQHALAFFPLEVWDVIAAHLVTPVATIGMQAVPEAAISLARFSCACAPLYEAAAAGWACLGSHVAPLIEVASSKSRALLDQMLQYCYRMPHAWMDELQYYGARRALNKHWTQEQLGQRRVGLRVKGHLCMRCMQYATHDCITHACQDCCDSCSSWSFCRSHRHLQAYNSM